MMHEPKRDRHVIILSIMAILCTVVSARSAEPPPPESEDHLRPPPVADTLKEQTIYIPYGKLRDVFERQGRGVFLPYEQFQELWRAARLATIKPPPQGPPIEALITEISSEATVAQDVVRVKATVHLEVLTEGWHEIPLRLSDSAITSATIGGQPARIVTDDIHGYRLVVEKTGDQPDQVELVLEYAKAFTRSPGLNSVSFDAPQAPINRWRVRVPQSGVKVNIRPLRAATEVPLGDPAERSADETVVLAFVGAAPSVQIDWTPRAEGATGLAALVTVESVQRVWVQEGVLRSTANLAYNISRATVDKLILRVPADQKVVNVFDANVRQWSVARTGTHQEITVELFEPAEGTQHVMVELERFGSSPTSDGHHGGPGAPGLHDEVDVPVVSAAHVGRQQGTVAVNVADGLRVEVLRRTGLVQMDASQLPDLGGGRRGPLPDGSGSDCAWALSYRYVSLPFELALRVEKVEPRITADTLVEAYLAPEELSLYVQTIYEIEKAGVFQLEFDIPAGYQVRNVRGLVAVGATPARLESHFTRDASEGRVQLVVNLGRKALGRVGIAFDLHRPLDEPDLLSPTGGTVEVVIHTPLPNGRGSASAPLPNGRGSEPTPHPDGRGSEPTPHPDGRGFESSRVAGDTVNRATGRLVIYAPQSLRVNPADAQGLRNITVTEAMKGMVPAGPEIVNRRRSKARAGTGRFAFAFAEHRARLTLKAERRKPHITARQLLLATIESAVVKCEATFFYDILYSGVESLRIDLPADLARRIHNDTSGVYEAVLDPPPEDLADGYTAWSFRGETAFTGSVTIKLSWETPIGPLDIGKSAELSIPHLRPMGVDRAWGQIVLAKAETIDIRTDSGVNAQAGMGLVPIDPRHDLMALPPGSATRRAARAFEFHDDRKEPAPGGVLTVTVTRYKLEEIKRTSMDRALLRMVVTRSDQLSVAALYRVRSARQRLALTLPQNVEFDTDPVRINGRPVSLERGQKDEFFVPLTGRSPEEAFLLEIRYTVPGCGTHLAIPAFPSQPAVQKVYISAYLPAEWTLLGSLGPWADELRWRRMGVLDYKPFPRRLERDLVSWVTEGVAAAGDPTDTFQTDGDPLLFSALGPIPPPDGGPTLTLVTVHEDLRAALVFAIVLAGGLILLRAKEAKRLWALGAFLTLLVLSGVFLPTFALQICDGVMASALVIVFVLWGLTYLAWTRPRDPNVIARKEARQEAALARIRHVVAIATAGPPEPPGLPESAKTTAEHKTPGGSEKAEESGDSTAGPNTGADPDKGKGGERDA